MRTLELIKGAYDIVSDERHWTQKRLQVVINGYQCFCSVGALYEIVGKKFPKLEDYRARIPMAKKAIEELEKTLREQIGTNSGAPDPCLVRFNDTHRHDEVMSIWKATIERLEMASP